MALFKILKGERDLPSEKVEGWAYVRKTGADSADFFVDYDGSTRLKINKYADRWTTPRTFSVTGDAYVNNSTTYVTIDGSGNISVPLYVNEALKLKCPDLRNTALTPQQTDIGVTARFWSRSISGLPEAAGLYAGVLTFRSYGSSTDLSGGYPMQWAYGQDGYLYHRLGTSTTAWGSWKSIIDSENYATHLDDRYINASGDTMTGALNFANGTWNFLGDDVYFGDNNTAGSFAIKGANGDTNIKFVQYGGTNYQLLTYDGSNNLTWSGSTITATNFVGNASTATVLETARTIQTNLASTSSASFNGSANVTPGVTGILAVGNGGTGKSSWTANRMIYPSAATTLVQAHYINDTKMAINSTSAPSYNLYVNGTGCCSGNMTVSTIILTASSDPTSPTKGQMWITT